MCSTNEIQSGKEIFKFMMEKSQNDDYFRLLSTSTTGTTMNSIKKTLKTFLLNIYQTWNDFDSKKSQINIDHIINHITFVSTAYIGKTSSVIIFIMKIFPIIRRSKEYRQCLARNINLLLHSN